MAERARKEPKGDTRNEAISVPRRSAPIPETPSNFRVEMKPSQNRPKFSRMTFNDSSLAILYPR